MLKNWLTKCHIYLGLFFLVEMWLLAVTGLFLNHPHWAVNYYRENSAWVESETNVQPIAEGDPTEKALAYMKQLDIEGELLGVREVAKENQFRFDVNRPGHDTKVVIDLQTGKTQLQEKKTDVYGVINQLHIFGEMKRFAPQKEGITWFATKVWVVTMDGLALGFIILVITAFYLWLKTRKLVGGLISLLLGMSLALFFLFL